MCLVPLSTSRSSTIRTDTDTGHKLQTKTTLPHELKILSFNFSGALLTRAWPVCLAPSLIVSCIEASCAKPKHWELVIRSGNIVRTTLGGVDRAFYRFTRQLKFHDFFNLFFADILHVGQLLNQARGLHRSSNE